MTEPQNRRLAYCEPPHAWPGYPWHIRELAAGEEPRPGGGISADTLCGVPLEGGWDIAGREPTAEDVTQLGSGCCRMCAAKVVRHG